MRMAALGMLSLLPPGTTMERLNSKQFSLPGYAVTPSDGLLRPKEDNVNGSSLVSTSAKSIIITSSVAGLYGEPRISPYVATKWASRGLSLSAAKELGPLGIRVNSLHPGATDTPMFQLAFDTPEKRAQIASTTALNRVAMPIEIARAMVSSQGGIYHCKLKSDPAFTAIPGIR